MRFGAVVFRVVADKRCRPGLDDIGAAREMRVIQLVYASAATQPFTPEALKLLLSKARARNSTYGVTGMLLYHRGSFLQVLEGPEAGVDRILASIVKDARHTTARTLSRATVSAREFEAWSMGFVDTTHSLAHPMGHVDYHRELPGLTQSASKARTFLRFFQEGLYREAS